MLKKQLFLFCLILVLSFQNSLAYNYFDIILAGVMKINPFQSAKVAEPGLKDSNYYSDSENKVIQKETQTIETSFDENPFLDTETQGYNSDNFEENSSADTSAEEIKQTEEEKLQEVEDKKETLLNSILIKLGFLKTPTNTQTTPNTVQTQNQNTQAPQQPNISNSPSPLNQVLQSVANEEQRKKQAEQYYAQQNNAGFQTPFTDAFNRGLQTGPTAPQILATPYTGPGGSLPGDCGIPKGPIAYNIGSANGGGARCNAKSVLVGFMGSIGSLPANVFGGGYFSSLVPKFSSSDLAAYKNEIKESNDGYGSKIFDNYNSPGATAFLDKQILHWKQQGKSRGQKCVPVDVDNCDDIGPTNYKIILDRIEESNKPEKNGGVLIKVLAKNIQLDKCTGNGAVNFLTHPAVIGAIIEENNPNELKNVLALRKSEQILLFASGSGSKTANSQQNLNQKKLETSKISNSAYSYDSGKEYEIVHDCIYKP